MNTIFGCFNLETKDLQLHNNSNAYYENEDFICSVYGDMWFEDVRNDYPKLLQAYQLYGDELVNHVEGLYYIILYDKTLELLKIYQDYFTCGETIYYTVVCDNIYFSNDMRQMISLHEVSREFNEAVAADFVKYGYVPGAETLIRDVYKLAPFCMLLCQKEQIIQQRLSYTFDIKDEVEASNNWVKDLNRAIRMNTPKEESVVLPLSGGFDSNYIFHYYNRTETPTRLFTIGGVDGIDETRMVQKIVNIYDAERNELNLRYTSKDTLQYLPDIIWRLGGLVYQRGIFLQYELAKELNKAGATTLVCGECADQVMHEDFLKSGILNEDTRYRGQANPYDFAAHIIIKKSAIMLNSFGIKGYYPYMNQQFVCTAMGLARKNGTTKEFHRKVCNQILPGKVTRFLFKNGGATDMHALFATKEEKEQFVRMVEGTDLFQTHQSVHGRRLTKAEKLKHIMGRKKEYSRKLVRKMLGTLGVQSVTTLTPQYQKMEQRLRRDMGYFYLLIFKELFCSENTDYYLKNGVDSFDVQAYMKRLGAKNFK